MNVAEYFPLVLATHKAFCNRVIEREQFKQNIAMTKHTLLLAPRRYGKTSLVMKVLHDIELPGQTVDFFAITDIQSFYQLLFDGVAVLLSELLPAQQNILQKIQHFFGQYHPTIELSLLGQRVKFNVDTNQSKPVDIIKLLQGLEDVAADINKKAILIMDEFQQINSLADVVALEGAIRHVVERCKHIYYVFSGSTRHMLEQQFEDDERPLFHCCDKIRLDRIAATDYSKHFDKAAKAKWQAKLDPAVANAILAATQRHPYYVNHGLS